MNFNWNENTIKWYQAANDYSGFFKHVADLIAPKIAGHATLCDIGCGLGLVDLELSKNLQSITCIDINKEAIASLNKSIEARQITNIQPRLMNCDTINESWDVIFVSFFGSRDLEKFLPYCKKLFAIVDQKKECKPYLEKYRSFHRNTYDNVKQQLSQKAINYSCTEVTLEFGQPLVSLDDAKNFIKTNYAAVNDEDLNRFLSQQLIETNNPDYPYYIKKNKSLGIFEIEGALI
ncbi:MAG: class I SAM-dependent methyltransferase [Acetobacterium sp.]|nr:class I SAM-dependent methyltransferase [Bacillota bacterium]MCG2729624.1 class I SAM-dependent methyltransferase [Acetobacterium sp.]